MSPKVFVTGATGTLGNAVAHSLIKIGWGVNATVRNMESATAKGLAAAGANLFPGDWNDKDALKTAMAGCDGLFLNLVPDFADVTADRRQGKDIITIAKAAGVRHAVYSSGVAVNEPERLEHYRPDSLLAVFLTSKKVLEDEVRTAGFESYTILRPAGFMANWLAPKVAMYGGLAQTGTYVTAMRRDTLVAQIDDRDVAAFVVAALGDPARFNGHEIELAGEVLTTDEIMRQLSEVTGRQLRAEYMSEDEIMEQKDKNPFVDGQLNSRDMIQFIDLAEVRKWGVPLHTFKEYLDRERDLVDKTYKQQWDSSTDSPYRTLPDMNKAMAGRAD